MTADQAIELTKVLVPVVLAFLVLGGTVVTGVFAYLGNKKMNAVAKETAEQTKAINSAVISTAENGRKSDVIIEKAAEIQTVSNGHLSRVTEELKETRLKVDAMQRMMDLMLVDKRDKQVIAEKLAEKAGHPAKDSAPAALKVETIKDVVIEGTLETKE